MDAAGRKNAAPEIRKTEWLVIGALVAVSAAVGLRGRHDEGERSAPVAGRSLGSQPPHRVHEARAAEPHRGRTAGSPADIPWPGWKDIFWRIYNQIIEDRLLAVAAGVVFYGLLAIFPAITAIVSVYGLFFDPTTIQGHLALISGVVPDQAFDVLQEQVNRIVSAGSTQLGLAFLGGLAVALWSANAGMKAIIDALNVAYDEVEQRSFVAVTLLSLTLTVCAIVGLIAAMAMVIVFPVALSFVGLGDQTELLLSWLRWPALLVAVMVGLAILYRFGPNRRKPRWQWISFGSVVATVGWLVGSALLSLYLSNFADYNATYGSLAAGIGLMMWLWLTAIVVLLGAEINAEIEHQTGRDTTVGADRPLGRRGAVVADTVGEAWR